MNDTLEIESPEPIAPDAAPAAEPAAPAAPVEPATSALDAMAKVLDRDEKGRFVSKEGQPAPADVVDAKPIAAKVEVSAKPADKPAEPEDLTAMPEGLGQKAQERFQKLATTNRELTERISAAEQQVSYVRETFQQHGVQRDQFEQAVGIIGALNRGDFAGAQKLLVEQLRQVSILSGQPIAGVDALAEFPDLRQKVDGFQIGEAEALELARMRKTQAAIQGQRQQQEQTAQARAASEAAVGKARADVDAWVNEMSAKDLDWPVIEDQLHPVLGDLLQDVPPERWLSTLKAQHNILKRAAARFRDQGQTAEPAPLRPAAAGAVQRPPRSAIEAMNSALGL